MCVCTGMRVRKWRCSECVWKRDLSKIYVNKKEKRNCVCVCVCVCGWVCVGVHTRAYVKRRDCVCLLERS